MIVYRKVKVSERLPKEGWVLTPSGGWMFHGGNFKCQHDGTIQQGINEWIEEIEFPNYDEINNYFYDKTLNENRLLDMKIGANYVLNKLNNNEG